MHVVPAALPARINTTSLVVKMTMKAEAGVFDLYAATRKTDVAEQVHDCLGRLLANVVVEAAKLTNADKKEIR
jgi:hypothetical protein